MAPQIGIGMVGYAFMGRAHSAAWRNVAAAFDGPVTPRLAAVCGRDEAGVAAAAGRLGWAAWETDWRRLIERDDVDLVDICTPGALHAPIAVAALEAGKHVLCEKPLANSVAEAEAMVEAARRAAAGGALAMVGFNYRRVPAIALAASLVAGGALGAVRHVRASYLQDWLADPEAPASWRLRREVAGSGALGDLGSHAVDLALHLTGLSVTEVVASTETFVRERPVAAGGSGLAAVGGRGTATVDVDDAFGALARLTGGATGSFEASRVAAGRKNALRVEINGEVGSLAFDLERLNELVVDDQRAGRDGGPRRVLVTEPDHPYLEAWWPPGHVLGWDHTFVHEARDLLSAVAAGEQPRPSFEDGLRVQRILAAIEASAASGRWEPAEQA